MNSPLFFACFDRITDAPDSLPRLRQFILDLAVRGKLVEQYPNDEPATELLGRIQTEKARLVKEGKINREKPPITAHPNDVGFALKPGWAAARISQLLVELQTGPFGSSLHQSDYQKGGVPVINPASIKNGRIVPIHRMAVGSSTVERLTTFKLRTGDIVLARRGEMGRCAIVSESESGWLCGTGSLILRLPDCLFPPFLVTLLGSPVVREYLGGSAVGATMQNLNQSILLNLVIGLPPVGEQRRIVAKVGELMALCDRLEAAKKDRERRRDRLVASSLHHLNNGGSAEAFGNHFRFYLTHLPSLTTRQEQIKQLRQTILNLAVRGQLAPQDPNDEPASELVNRIQTGRGHASAPLSEITVDAAPFLLPPGWQWVRFGQIITEADAGWSPKSEGFPRSGDKWGVLKVSAVSWDQFLPNENKQLLPDVVPPERTLVRRGDFLISRANTSELVAKCVVVKEAPRNLILSDKIVRLQIAEECNKQFVCMVNNHAAHARSYYAEEASGTSLSMKNVSRAVIYALAIPLPPAAEQCRIVAKVDELMALCDRLEEQLATSQTESRRLLESILSQALNDTRH